MNHRHGSNPEVNAISRAISHGADEMCRRSIEVRRYVAMITGRPMVKDCPSCPYVKCIIMDDRLMSREDVAAALHHRREDATAATAQRREGLRLAQH